MCQGALGFAGVAYQAWVAPQCGQLTLVETGAMKKHPHEHG
jgi:hypothetical protein